MFRCEQIIALGINHGNLMLPYIEYGTIFFKLKNIYLSFYTKIILGRLIYYSIIINVQQ